MNTSLFPIFSLLSGKFLRNEGNMTPKKSKFAQNFEEVKHIGKQQSLVNKKLCTRESREESQHCTGFFRKGEIGSPWRSRSLLAMMRQECREQS